MDERLEMFTTDKRGKYDLTRPWHDSGWDYATDARICVRTPAIESKETAIGDRLVPEAHVFFTPVSSDAKWLPWPEVLRDQKHPQCPRCGYQPDGIVAAGRIIGNYYAERIANLGNAEFLVDSESSDAPLAFRASGGLEGRVMPIVET